MSKKIKFIIGKETYKEEEIIDLANEGLAKINEKGKQENIILTIDKAINELISRGIRVEKK